MPTTGAFPINAAEFADYPGYDFSAVIDRMEALANVKSVGQKAWREQYRRSLPGKRH